LEVNCLATSAQRSAPKTSVPHPTASRDALVLAASAAVDDNIAPIVGMTGRWHSCCCLSAVQANVQRRTEVDRRRMPRGGRRDYDRPGRHPRVLVADSYDGARQSCARYLERFHFDVVEAADGEAALARILAAPPRLILSEWDLPTMPAARLKRWLAQGGVGDIPVIVLTTTVEAGEEVPRVAGILRKPFSLVDMLQEVRRALRAA